MATKFAALNSYPGFNIPPRLSGLVHFPVDPRQNHRLSLPRIAVLVEPDDSDDEGPLLSYHSLSLKAYDRARATSPDDVDDLEKKGLVSATTHDAPVANKKPTDTTNKWDYYVAPLSPLSDLTESESSDSDDDVQSKPRVNEPATNPLLNARMGPGTDPLPSSSGLKRKRSCDSGITLGSPTTTDSEGPSKRLRRITGISRQSSESESATAARHGLSKLISPQSKKNNRQVFGTVRKPRVMQTAQGVNFKQKRARS